MDPAYQNLSRSLTRALSLSALLSFPRVIKVYQNRMFRDSFSKLDTFLKELGVVNRDLVSQSTEMPSTSCVLNLHKYIPIDQTKTGRTDMRLIAPQIANASNAHFSHEIRRKHRDEYLGVTQSSLGWRYSLHREHPIFLAFMRHIHGWAAYNLPTAPAAVPQRGEQVTGGVNLLSVGQSDLVFFASSMLMQARRWRRSRPSKSSCDRKDHARDCKN